MHPTSTILTRTLTGREPSAKMWDEFCLFLVKREGPYFVWPMSMNSTLYLFTLSIFIVIVLPLPSLTGLVCVARLLCFPGGKVPLKTLYPLLVPRPNPLARKGSGVTSLDPWACGSVD